MAARAKGSLVGGLVYIILGIACLGIGAVGVSYKLDPEAESQLFYKKGATRINKGDAALGMIPIGFLGGAACVAVAVLRMRGRKEEE